MLLSHSLTYLVGRVIPAFTSLLAVAAYTRLLTPEDYGLYAVAVAAAGFVSATAFQWVGLSAGRLYPQCAASREEQALIATSATMLVTLSGIAIASASLASLLGNSWPIQDFLVLISLVACAQGWFDLNSRLANASLTPLQFSIMAAVRGTVALGLGAAAIVLGFGITGLLVALVIGLFSATFVSFASWRKISASQVRFSMATKLWRFGSPLAITFALTYVIDASDRIFLAWMKDAGEAGIYSAAYDITQFALGSLASVVHLAAFPLVIKSYEETGKEGAAGPLRQAALLLLGVTMPAAAGLAILAPNIATVALGSSFHLGSTQVISWVALAIFISGVKSFYFDYSFFLGNRMDALAAVMGVAAAVNVAANLALIPLLGPTGAAIATVLAFSTGLILSWRAGRRIFSLPRAPKETWKIVAATTLMALALYPFRQETGAQWLVLQVAIGATGYVAWILILNVAGVRTFVRSLIVRPVGQ